MGDVVKNVEPGGGGDYADLQSYEDDGDGMSTASDRWVAECGAGDIGEAVFAGWSNEDTRVYAASSAKHNGQITQALSGIAHIDHSGADIGIDVQISSFEIDGIRIKEMRSAGNAFLINLQTASKTGLVVKNCILEAAGTTTGFEECIRITITTSGHRVINNLVVANGNASTKCFPLELRACTEASHNTVGTANSGNINDSMNLEAVCTNVYNNVLTGATNECIDQNATPTNRGDNATEDATGDSGHQNLTDTDIFEDPANGDFTPKVGGNLIDAGTDRTSEAGLDTDVFGTVRSVPPEIGAIELVAAGGGLGGVTDPSSHSPSRSSSYSASNPPHGCH